MTTPTIGRIVHYTVTEAEAAATNKRRADFAAHRKTEGYSDTGYVAHTGNRVTAGDVFPAMIVRVWGDQPGSAVQLQVFLDGVDTLWATSVTEGEGERHFAWPSRT